jgi:hypothetical protein
VIALWKDAARGTREIPLEAGAQGVLVSASTDRATRRSSDGRWPVENGSEAFEMSVYQVRAASAGSGWPARPRRVLGFDDSGALQFPGVAPASIVRMFRDARATVIPARDADH